MLESEWNRVEVWGVVAITNPDRFSSWRGGSSQRVSCWEMTRKLRGRFSGRDVEKTAVAHHVMSHALHAREIFQCEQRQEVSTRMWYNDRSAGARRATFSHFLTRQLHHFLSSYCTYVHSLSPPAEPYDNVAWCQRMWYPHIFEKTSHCSHFSCRCHAKIPTSPF